MVQPTTPIDEQGAGDDGTATSADIAAATATPASGDWALLSGFPGGATPSKLTNFTAMSTAEVVGLNGTYQVLAVDGTNITLANPGSVNTNWNNIQVASVYGSPSLTTMGEAWIGPFVVNMSDCTTVAANFVAESGMYRVQGKTGKNLAQFVDVLLEITPCDYRGTLAGPAVTSQTRVYGDGTDRTAKGVTLNAPTGVTGLVSVRARRLTNHDLGADNDTVADEVKWRDCYGLAPVTISHFGDVTTVVTTTYATAGATSVKERKLNSRVVRRVLTRNSDGTIGPGLLASRNAGDIFCHMATDPYIGGRPVGELDIIQIRETLGDVATYFGISDAAEFGYTFDQSSASAEELLQAVAQAVFCTAYRQGSQLRLFFERQTTDSVLLFNHRNKSPGSETRTVTFGNLNDYDGVELDYVSVVDGAKLTVYVPENRSSVKPKKLDVSGVIDRRGDAAVPMLLANRAWNKILFQNTTTEFDALAEASQLVTSQRIEVSDNTRPDVFDGEVLAQLGLTLMLSQPFTPVAGVTYTIFLQMPDGGVETHDCTPGTDPYHCVLATAPTQPLVTSDTAAVLTTYQITGSTDTRPTAFLVSDRGTFDKSTVQVQAINYDARYYQNDHDYGGSD